MQSEYFRSLVAHDFSPKQKRSENRFISSFRAFWFFLNEIIFLHFKRMITFYIHFALVLIRRGRFELADLNDLSNFL